MYTITKITRGTTSGPDKKTWSSKTIISDRSARSARHLKPSDPLEANLKIDEIDAHIEDLDIDTINFNIEALDTLDNLNDTADKLGDSITYDNFEEIEKIENVDFFDLFIPDIITSQEVRSEAIIFDLADQGNDDISEDSLHELINTPNTIAEECYNDLQNSFYDDEIIIWAQNESNHHLIIVACAFFGESLLQPKLQTVTIKNLGLSVLVIDPEQKHCYFPNASDDKNDKTTLTRQKASIKRQQLKVTKIKSLGQNYSQSRKRLKKNDDAQGIEKKRARISPAASNDPPIDPSYIASSSSAPQPTPKQKNVSIPACADLNTSGIANDRSLILAKEGDCYCSNCDQFTEKEPLVSAEGQELYQCSECKQHYAYAKNPIELHYRARLCEKCLEHAMKKGCRWNNNKPFEFRPKCKQCTQPTTVFTSEARRVSQRLPLFRPVVRSKIKKSSSLSPTFLKGVKMMLTLLIPKKSGSFYPKCFYCKSHIFYQHKRTIVLNKYILEKFLCRACKSKQSVMYSKVRLNVNPNTLIRYDFELSLCILCDKLTPKVIIKNRDKSIKSLICRYCQKKYPYPGYKLVIRSATATCKKCNKLIPNHMGRLHHYDEDKHEIYSYYCDQCQSYFYSTIEDNKHIISHIGYLSHYNPKNNGLPQSLKKGIDKGVVIPVEKPKYKRFLRPICKECRTSLYIFVQTYFEKSHSVYFQCNACDTRTPKLSVSEFKQG